MYSWASITVFFSNMAACRAGVEDDEESCMSCLNTTKYRCLRCLSKKPCLNFAQDVFKRFSRDPESLLKSLIGIWMQHFLDPSLVSLEKTTFTMMKRGRVLSGKQEKGRQKGKLYQKMTSTFQKES